MLERLITFSAKNKYLVILFTAALLAIAVWCAKNIPLDALPDLSDTQVIIYSRWDQSPDIIEAQVTYPIVTALLGAPKVKDIRGFSDFGFSYVYVIFEDGTDIYWARSRTLEYLSKISASLPAGVKTELGPDATSLGWVYQYALEDQSGKNDLADLRSLQDWTVRYSLQSTPGVAEVATIGGHVKQYQISVDPRALLAYNLPLMEVVDAVRKSNRDMGGRLVEINDREYMVRGRGYIRSLADIENIAVGVDEKNGSPILVKHVAHVDIGPEIRRGVVDFNGKGDTVSGIAVMRYGENALNVIDRVKHSLRDIKRSLPDTVDIVSVYDRSDLIHRAINTLKHTLIDEIVIVSLIILLFLWHVPSALTAIITIPISVSLAFIPLYLLGITTNIMSLAGIAISIGILVDGAIVEVENLYHRTQLWLASDRKEAIETVRLKAFTEVGPVVFFSLLIISISFLPIFTLVDQEGRLFKPLAYSKNIAMAIAAFLAVTFDPAVRMLFSRINPFTFRPAFLAKFATHALIGRYYNEEKHPVSRVLFRFYEPACRFVLRHRKQTLVAAVLLLASTIPAYFLLGSEFMPPLNEGAILYMPTTLPGISIAEAERSLQIQDRLLMQFPEVERVLGKVGRADSSTDPAPLSMAETLVVLKDPSEWRAVPRWYASLPNFLHPLFRPFWPDRISWEALIAEMDKTLQVPGWTNAWTMPIKNRIDMLSTGIRTPVGIKIFGDDLKQIEAIGSSLETALKDVPGTRSVFSERIAGGYFIDFVLKRDQLARYGLTIDDAQMVLASAVGGETITTTVEGRARYPVNVRYARELRDNVSALKRVLIPTPAGAQIPLEAIANIALESGPSMIRNENGLLAGYVYIDMAGRDIGSYVKDAKSAVDKAVSIPVGYALKWSGQYENMERVRERLKIVVPLTILAIFLLLYMNTRSVVKSGIVMLAVPFSLIGAVWFLYFLGYNLSIAVWVGMIALMGLDAETGVFMLLFLDLSYKEWQESGKLKTPADLTEAIVHGAVKRVRPKMMTVLAALMGLLPIMWSTGAGADVMKRIAAPMIGGLVSSFILELLIYPAIFSLWKERRFAQKKVAIS